MPARVVAVVAAPLAIPCVAAIPAWAVAAALTGVRVAGLPRFGRAAPAADKVRDASSTAISERKKFESLERGALAEARCVSRRSKPDQSWKLAHQRVNWCLFDSCGMVPAPQRTALSGPTLVRLLARLADIDVAESKQSLSDRLSQWLGWTDAIALSAALNGSPPAVTRATSALGSAEEELGARVRQSLTKAIADDGTFAAEPRSRAVQASSQEPETDATVEYLVFRQRYLSLQQAMESDIGNLRGRLRAMLAARSPGMAQLASVDAVMEGALGTRERSLLASVPALLGAYFERLRRAEQQALVDANARVSGEAAPATPNARLNVFRKDMKSVLLAELDIRFQPVEGLLAALRSS
jgi:Protein of unknown function (DUF3348)